MLRPQYKEFFENNKKDCVYYLCQNPSNNAMDIVERYPEFIEWGLSANSSDRAVDILFKDPSLIYYPFLSRNSNSRVIQHLKENPHRIDWEHVSMNTNDEAIDLLDQNRDKIHWDHLVRNTNPNAVSLIKSDPTRFYLTPYDPKEFIQPHPLDPTDVKASDFENPEVFM